MIINGEDCCETSAPGFPCSCHLFKRRMNDDDEYGDYLYEKSKDDRDIDDFKWIESGEI